MLSKEEEKKEATDIWNRSKKGVLVYILLCAYVNNWYIEPDNIGDTPLSWSTILTFLGLKKEGKGPNIWRMSTQKKIGPICKIKNDGSVKIRKPWRKIVKQLVKINITNQMLSFQYQQH